MNENGTMVRVTFYLDKQTLNRLRTLMPHLTTKTGVVNLNRSDTLRLLLRSGIAEAERQMEEGAGFTARIRAAEKEGQ